MRKKIIAASCAGLICVGAAFALSTPYFFLNFKAAKRSLHEEAEKSRLGPRSLSLTGNVRWYVRDAIPSGITAPVALLALLGGLLVMFRRRFTECLLLGYAVIFLLTISMLSLHWERWIIPALPVLALLAAFSLDAVTRWVSRLVKKEGAVQRASLALCLAAVSVPPAYGAVAHDIRESHTSTRTEAREWLIRNVPAGSRIALEGHTAPLVGAGFITKEAVSLAEGHNVDDYCRQGYRYFVIRRDVEKSYTSHPERFRNEMNFYRDLVQDGDLLATFLPSKERGGPGIDIYRIPDRKTPK